MIYAIIAIVSGALIIGALWGIYGPLKKTAEGFLVALAGGALIVALVLEMIEPALQNTNLGQASFYILLGAASFTFIDYWIDEKWGPDSGGGLLAAITLDGIPENLALGVALIGAGVADTAALAAAILLSNLPEAMGGAKDMTEKGISKRKIMFLWVGCAVLLSASAIVGNIYFTDADPESLAHIGCFAAGAVVASLATEVFPKAFEEDHHLSGIAVAIGFILAYSLTKIGG